MPFRLSPTGPEGLPKTQAEVDERRAARLAKRANDGGIAKTRRKAKKPKGQAQDMELASDAAREQAARPWFPGLSGEFDTADVEEEYEEVGASRPER